MHRPSEPAHPGTVDLSADLQTKKIPLEVRAALVLLRWALYIFFGLIVLALPGLLGLAFAPISPGEGDTIIKFTIPYLACYAMWGIVHWIGCLCLDVWHMALNAAKESDD